MVQYLGLGIHTPCINLSRLQQGTGHRISHLAEDGAQAEDCLRLSQGHLLAENPQRLAHVRLARLLDLPQLRWPASTLSRPHIPNTL